VNKRENSSIWTDPDTYVRYFWSPSFFTDCTHTLHWRRVKYSTPNSVIVPI